MECLQKTWEGVDVVIVNRLPIIHFVVSWLLSPVPWSTVLLSYRQCHTHVRVIYKNYIMYRLRSSLNEQTVNLVSLEYAKS